MTTDRETNSRNGIDWMLFSIVHPRFDWLVCARNSNGRMHAEMVSGSRDLARQMGRNLCDAIHDAQESQS